MEYFPRTTDQSTYQSHYLAIKKFNFDRALRWKLYNGKYFPDLNYTQGEKNVVADALSRLNMEKNQSKKCFITEKMCQDWY